MNGSLTGEPFTSFSGSYDPEDVTFLLKRVWIRPTPVEEKERWIQTGARHYSEMISEERRPDVRYCDIFEDALARNTERMGADIARIAATIANRVERGELPRDITLCSLVRAGVPYGVLIQRELKALSVDSVHYGVSIIRDRGIDINAMKYIFQRRNPSGILFVDGWTGKGAISRELQKSWTDLGHKVEPELVVLADPAGFATLSGSHDDWLIPSGIMGANVSGLISRSILNPTLVGPYDFHGTMLVEQLRDIDYSRRFVDTVSLAVVAARGAVEPISLDKAKLGSLRAASANCVKVIADTYGVDNLNRIKPGIAEATRAVLRRRPDRVFVRNAADPDIAALIYLCRTDNVPIVECALTSGPYRAITLIEKVS